MAAQHSASGSIAEDLFIELFSEAFGATKAGYLYSQYYFMISTRTAGMQISFWRAMDVR